MGTNPERTRLWERCVAAFAAADPAGISLWTLAAMTEDLGVTSLRPSEVSRSTSVPADSVTSGAGRP